MQLHEGRPKQKRHRCRNPNKLDINSLTGEERVQLINRRNARKVIITSPMWIGCAYPERLKERFPGQREPISAALMKSSTGLRKLLWWYWRFVWVKAL